MDEEQRENRHTEDRIQVGETLTEVRHILWAIFLVIALGGLLFTFWLWANRSYAEKNRESIRVSCVLLGNAIVESGAAAMEGDDEKPPTPQQRLTALAFDELISRSRGKRHEEMLKLIKQTRAGQGGSLTLPNCKEIVLHPERVEAKFKE